MLKKNGMKISLLLIVCAILSSCGTTVVNEDHRDVVIPSLCVFSKFTLEEKLTMTDAVVTRTFDNQQDCYDRAERVQKLIDGHNEVYKND